MVDLTEVADVRALRLAAIRYGRWYPEHPVVVTTPTSPTAVGPYTISNVEVSPLGAAEGVEGSMIGSPDVAEVRERGL